MNQSDTSPRLESESGVETARAAAKRGREYVSRVAPYLRHGVESGAVTTIIGGTALLGGLRAFLGGERKRGVARLALGAAFLAAALAQRRSRSRGRESAVEVTDVVDAGPDVEAIADEAGDVGEEDRAAGEAAAEVTDTSPNIEDVESGLESDSDAGSAAVDQREVVDTGVDTDDLAAETERETEDVGDEEAASDGTTADAEGTGADVDAETEEVDRLGEAAFDGQSREVPAPQRAFNRGFLAHSAEAFWGIRSRDDAVLVSQDYDAIEGRDGVRYVASTQIGEDVRELPIPDAVLDHWDEVIGGGTAVTGGDGILFVTTDGLAADGLLRVLPAEWADDASG